MTGDEYIDENGLAGSMDLPMATDEGYSNEMPVEGAIGVENIAY